MGRMGKAHYFVPREHILNLWPPQKLIKLGGGFPANTSSLLYDGDFPSMAKGEKRCMRRRISISESIPRAEIPREVQAEPQVWCFGLCIHPGTAHLCFISIYFPLQLFAGICLVLISAFCEQEFILNYCSGSANRTGMSGYILRTFFSGLKCNLQVLEQHQIFRALSRVKK